MVKETQQNLEKLTVQDDGVYNSKKERINIIPVGRPFNLHVRVFDGDDEDSIQKKEEKANANLMREVIKNKPMSADSYIIGARNNVTPYGLVISFSHDLLYPIQYYRII